MTTNNEEPTLTLAEVFHRVVVTAGEAGHILTQLAELFGGGAQANLGSNLRNAAADVANSQPEVKTDPVPPPVMQPAESTQAPDVVNATGNQNTPPQNEVRATTDSPVGPS